ncbi:hypothetical protein ACLOJK_038043 [Asimina triloba]
MEEECKFPEEIVEEILCRLPSKSLARCRCLVEMEEECKFPEEIVEEILCRLPRKSLARCRCVSKQWLTLISDCNRVFPKTTHLGLVCQSFLMPPIVDEASGQIQHCSRVNFLQVDSKGKGNAYLECSKLSSMGQDYVLIDSWNGFLLFRNRPPAHQEQCKVYHPATDRSWHITSPASTNLRFSLAPDAHAHHFKLVRIFKTRIDFKKSIGSQVYSSYNEEWGKEPLTSFPLPNPYVGIDWERSIFVKGASHWIWFNYLVIYRLEDGHCEFVKLPRVPDSDYWALPFLYLSQSDIAAIVMRDGEPSNPCLVEMRKRRLCTTTTILEAQLLFKLTHLMEATINACLAPLVAEIDKLNASLAQLEAKIDNLTQSQPQTQSPTQPEPEPQP